jgi:hypothetical protein
MASDMRCCVCLSTSEELTEAKTKLIDCPFCPKATCKTCLNKYIIEGTLVPCCPNPECKKVYDNEFLKKVFSKKFVETEIRLKNENLLYAEETAKLPETTAKIARRLEYEREFNEVDNEIGKFLKQVMELDEKINELRLKREHIKTELKEKGEKGEKGEEKERRKFVMPCPMEGCRGFLSSQWKCGICGSNICKDCRKNIDRKDDDGKDLKYEINSETPHVCSDDDKKLCWRSNIIQNTARVAE